MAEKVLVAVDESAFASRVVAYVGRIFGQRPAEDVAITLFHVVEGFPTGLVPPMTDPDLDQGVQQALREWSAQRVARSRQMLETYREALVAAGVSAAAVGVKQNVQEVRPEARRNAAAAAILNEAADRGYSTVVLGRLGSSKLPEFYVGSVTEKVTRHLTGATLWIVV